jgi:hypothetical protein
MGDDDTDSLLAVKGPGPATLDRDCEPLLDRFDGQPRLVTTDGFMPKGKDYYDGDSGLQNCCVTPAQVLVEPTCCNEQGGYQLLATGLDRHGGHTACDVSSLAVVRDAVGEQFSSFVEGLLIHDDSRKTAEDLHVEDLRLVKWLRTLAKVASRDIHICCVPVSELAGVLLKHELIKIRDGEPESAAWHGKTRWWLSDASMQVNGEDRVQRVVSNLIRSESESHAYDSTSRRKVPKHQKQHDHSLFRQLAENFSPPGADQATISSTTSNHAVAGASRTVGVTATRDALHNTGYRMYDESISGRKTDKRAAGRREVHGIKDLQHPNPDDAYEAGMVYTFVDQDMYVNSFSKYAGENMVIITPEYNKLAGVGTDSTWYYTVAAAGDVVVTERVATVNGSTYHTQRPWDYGANDFIYIEHSGNIAFTTYNVHIQYQPGSHHKWVWLARNTTTKLSKAVCDMMCMVAQGAPLDGVPLRKASNVVAVKGDSKTKEDTFLLGLFGDPKSPTYSIKYAYDQGADTSVELTENQYKVFTLMGKNRPKGYGVSEVKRTLQMHMMWRPGGMEPILVAFFGIPIEYRPRPNIMYTGQAGSLDEEVVETGSAVAGAPNVAGGGPGVADTRSDAAFKAYEEKRLDAYANEIDPPENIKALVSMLLPRMIELVSGESGIELGSLTMVGPEKIYQIRNQALQAARLQRHSELVARESVPKTNLKHEVGPKASIAPRGITQYTEEMAIQTGRVGLLVKEILKHCGFYQPGNSPHDIAMAVRKITEIAMHASSDKEGGRVSGLHDTDYSKMDETISKYIYTWFVDFVLAFVHKSDYEEVKKILWANVDITTMLNGKPKKTGFKNNSGSGLTTELNTFVSAFVEFVSTCLAIVKSSYRLHHKTEIDLSDVKKTTIRTALKQYKNTVEASFGSNMSLFLWGDFMFKRKEIDIYSIPYAVIGVKFGDDGVGPHLPHISDDDWRDSALYFTEAIGMKLKVSFSNPEDGTFFLGRYYPKPLESLASYADVLRALRKISVARNLDVDKYMLKLRGYWTTDSKTPGIREYLIAVAKMYDFDLDHFNGLVEYDSDGTPVLSKEMAKLLATDRDMFYRVVGGPYCVEDDDVPMMLEAIATQVNFECSSELESWLQSLATCTTWEEIDSFQLPGMDFDPDDEPEGTLRMAGPVANLLSRPPSTSSTSTFAGELTIDDLAAAASAALMELLQEEEAEKKPPYRA